MSSPISLPNLDFIPFTKIKSAEIDANFNAIQTYINAKVSPGLGSANRVVITDGSGNLSSEATLATSRGGTGTDINTTGLILTEIATPSTPSSGYGKIYFKSDGFLYQLNDDGTETKVGAGGGGTGSGTNYVLNPDFESNTSQWSSYSDVATFTNSDVDTGTDTITVASHGLLNDDKVVFTSAGTLPAGLTAGTTYYIINKATNTFQVSTSLNGSAVDLTTGGSGTHSVRPLQPIDATGGTATLTITRSTSSPLFGSANGLITKDAATRAGEGISTTLGVSTTDLNINRGDLAQLLQVQFTYEIASGTFTPGSDSDEGDLKVFIIDTTSGTRIPLSPAKLTGAVAGIRYRYTGVFQTHASNRSYRLAIHDSSATGNAFTVKIDNVSVGPQVKELGIPAFDSLAYTPSGAWSTNTTYMGFYGRQGEYLLGRVRVATSGVPDTATLTASLPSGLVIDTAKLLGASALNNALGTATIVDSGTRSYPGIVVMASTTSVQVVCAETTGEATSVVTEDNPFAFGAGDYVDLEFKAPIVGWSSNVVMSSDADTRVMALRASGNPASASAGNPIIFPTKDYDTHGVYSVSTGQCTAPAPGLYKVHGVIESADAGVGLFAYVNNVSVIKVGATDSNGEASYTGTVKVNAGDLIDVRPDNTLDAAANSTLCIERISGPEQIAATETIAFRGNNLAGALSNLTESGDLIFGSTDYDTHSMSASGVQTVPAAGLYTVKAFVNTQNVTSGAINNYFALRIYKNGVLYSEAQDRAETTATRVFCVTITDDIKCNAGDTITLRAYNSIGNSLNYSGVSTQTYFSVRRAGI